MKSWSCAEILNGNRLQSIDSEQKKYSYRRGITGYCGNALKQLKPDSLPTTLDFPLNEGARNIHAETRLSDSRVRAFFRQQVKILNATIQHVDGMNHPQPTDFRDFHLDGTPSEILCRQADDARQEIYLLHPAVPSAVGDLAGLRSRVIKCRYPGLPAKTFSEIPGHNSITDEIGICRHTRHEVCRSLNLEMVCPKSECLATDEKTVR